MKQGLEVEPTTGRQRQYQVRVIDRVMAILNELAIGPGEKGDVDLAARLGLHKSTVHRLLAVMERSGLVERKAGTAKYRLGWRLFDLGMVAASRLDLVDRAAPYITRLVQSTGETAHFGVLGRGQVVSLASSGSRHTARTPATVGRRIPLHCTSQGKAILAFLQPDELERELQNYSFTAYAPNTIIRRSRFLAELALVTERGYAVDNEEFEDGLRCIGAPVRNDTGGVIGAISIAGPSYRITGARLQALSSEVVRAAADFSAELARRAAPCPRTAPFREDAFQQVKRTLVAYHRDAMR